MVSLYNIPNVLNQYTYELSFQTLLCLKKLEIINRLNISIPRIIIEKLGWQIIH